MKVYFLPPGSEENKSLTMIVEGLEKNGAIVVNKGYDGNPFIKAVSSFIAYSRGARIFHFNFLENYAANSGIKSSCFSTIILIWLRILKLLKCNLIWTMNNKVPHDCRDDGQFYRSFLQKYLKLMDATVVYCKESRDILVDEYGYDENKICSVAHGCFVPRKSISKTINKDRKLHILSFGLIEEYKNIPLLIKSFNKANVSNSILRIYGRCKNQELLERIKCEIANCSNVEFYEGFLPEDEVDSVFEWADLFVCPYEKTSMLNSGAAIMGISQGKVTLASEFGYIKDIKGSDFVISYDYKCLEDHVNNLTNKLKELDELYMSDPNCFLTKGQMAYEFAQKNLDWNNICKQIIKYYK